MQSKAFRNPHIYAKLVQFVDIDETATNFPKDIWDPTDVKEDWYADKIGASHVQNLQEALTSASAVHQKQKSEQVTSSQSRGQRTRIAFEPAKTSAPTSSKKEIQAHRYRPYDDSQTTGSGGRVRKHDPYGRYLGPGRSP
jgi:hypothetical protein